MHPRDRDGRDGGTRTLETGRMKAVLLLAHRGCRPGSRARLSWLMRPRCHLRLPCGLPGLNRTAATKFRRLGARSTSREESLATRSRTWLDSLRRAALTSGETARCARSESNRATPLRRRQPGPPGRARRPGRESDPQPAVCSRRTSPENRVIERVTGIEPAPQRWQRRARPSSCTRMERPARFELASSAWKAGP
jgi:hypothetical protein